MKRKTRGALKKEDPGKANASISSLFAKAQTKPKGEAKPVIVVLVESEEIGQYVRNNLSCYSNIESASKHDLDDILEDQNKLVQAVTQLALSEDAKLPTRDVIESLLRCIEENRSAKLSLAAYEALQNIHERFPSTSTSERAGSPQLYINPKVWTPGERALGAPEDCQLKARPGAHYRLQKDGSLPKPADFLTVLEQVASDVCKAGVRGNGRGQRAPADVSTASARGRTRRGRREATGEAEKAAVASQAEIEATQQLGSLLVLQYLVQLMRDDLSSRLTVFQAHGGPHLLQESIFHRVVGGFHIARFDRDRVWEQCVAIIAATAPANEPETSRPGTDDAEVSDDACKYWEAALKYTACPADICTVAQTILAMAMSLFQALDEAQVYTGEPQNAREDMLKNVARYFRSICEGVPAKSHFLQTMLDPRHKVKLIVEYFLSCAPKAVVAVSALLDEKRQVAQEEDLLQALLENPKAILKSLDSNELALLATQAVQARFQLGGVDKSFLGLVRDAMQSFNAAVQDRNDELDEAIQQALISLSITSKALSRVVPVAA